MELRKLFKVFLLLSILSIAVTAYGDAVTDWSGRLEQLVYAVAQPVPAQPRSAAIVHTAIFDAVNGIARKYDPYFVKTWGPPGGRQEAAAAQAAYTTMLSLYPSQKPALDAFLQEALGKIPGNQGDSQSIASGREWGEYVARQILTWRSTDGFSTPPPPYFGGTGPGIWRSPPTPTNADGTLPALFPQLAVLTPFAMNTTTQFRPGPPPALSSAQYAADVNEVKAIGRFDSTVRTPDQTKLALLWQAAGLIDEIRAFRSLVPAKNSLVDNARLFALVSITASDALIIGFDSKYAYNRWRPYHAIRLADTDDNPDTEADPTWNSLFLAPRFQEYVSNHSTLTSSVMRVLARELGDAQTFTLDSPGMPGFTWTFDRFSDAAAQVIEARIWGGIHFRTSDELGGKLGVQLADYVLDHFLLPGSNRGF
jgi:PAP2 superfamily